MTANFTIRAGDASLVTLRALDLGDGTEIIQSAISSTSGNPVSPANPLPLVEQYPSNIVTGQVTVGTTATLICAARPGRSSITMVQEGATDVRIGDGTVTLTTGCVLMGTPYTAFSIGGGAAIYGIVESGTQVVSYVESY